MMKCLKREDGWWIVNEGEDYGPYDTKAEAEEDRRGLERTMEHWNERRFWTSDK